MAIRSCTVGILAIALAGCVSAPIKTTAVGNTACAMAPDDLRWLRGVLQGWPDVSSRYLQTAPPQLPEMIFFDARCSFQSTPGSPPSRWIAKPHRGTIIIANGPTFEVGPQAAFNSLDDDRGFLVMSLPSIWRTVAPPSEIPLDTFLEGVAYHELTHSLQAVRAPSLWWRALVKQGVAPNVIGDDAVQHNFSSNTAYVTAFKRETDSLYKAASATTTYDARALTCQALAAMRSRRATYFQNAENDWARVDEIALTSEGLGQWVAWRWLTQRRGVSTKLATSKLRSDFWSQDEGLAIFLVLQRLLPSWQKRLLSPKPDGISALLGQACKGE